MSIIEKNKTFIVYNERLTLLKNEHNSFCQIGADMQTLCFLHLSPSKQN